MINWVITAMDCYPQADGQTDVVFVAHWSCIASQDEYSTTIYSTCAIPAPTGTFVPYADLTQDQVLGWVWANGVDQTATEAAANQQLANLITPPVVSPPLPWLP